jgi:3-dehydroquinate synthase II
MKFFWVEAGKNIEIVRAAIESGAEAVLVAKEISKVVRDLGRIKIIGKNFGDLQVGKEIATVEIATKEDEKMAIELSRKFEYLIIICKDWKVIPLENLIAQSSAKIIAKVESAKEARIAFEILEKGVDGVLLSTEDPKEIQATRKVLEERNLEKVELVEAEITQIIPTRSGERVCVDTIDLMKEGEGLLVGNYGNRFFLVQAECIENPFVKPRPFRINAGDISAYCLLPKGKTKYLSELQSNDEVLIVNTKGEGKTVTVSRVKIEERPMVFVKAVFQGQEAVIFLQNAETIRLVSGEGKPISIAQLREGDKVLCHFGKEKGRHLGIEVKESIIER